MKLRKLNWKKGAAHTNKEKYKRFKNRGLGATGDLNETRNRNADNIIVINIIINIITSSSSSSSSSSLYLVKKNRMKIGKCNNITWKRRKMERARKTIDYVARAGSWAAAGC